MSTIDVSQWTMLNMWRESDGDLCVRPGLRALEAIEAAPVLGGFSVRCGFDNEVWHYVVTDESASGGGVDLVIYDESFTPFQRFVWSGSPQQVRGVSCAVVQGQMLICSPDLPTLYGVVGSGVGFAEAVASENPATTALTSVPRGIVIAIANRAVIANGRSLFVSDPIGLDGGDLRTFVGQNQNQRPGIVYGLHEGAGGMLIAVTSEGTYGLDLDAFALQVVGMNGTAWRLLSHITAQSFDSTCTHRGRVYALTKDGFAPCDTDSDQEMRIADPTMPRARGPRISATDFRRARIYSLEEGPAIASEYLGAIFRTDLQTKTFSWWRDQTATPGSLRGVLRGHDGTEMLLIDEAAYVITGDFDGEQVLTGADTEDQPFGVIFGVLPSKGTDNLLPRKVSHAAAIDGAHRIAIAVRGSEHTATVSADPFGITANTMLWANTGTQRWLTTPIAGVEIDFGDITDTKATRDIGIELSVEGCGVRVNTMPEIIFSESARRRPQGKG